MKRTLEGMAKAGEPLLRDALDAIWAHQAAQDSGASPETIERLRVDRFPLSRGSGFPIA